MARIRTVKPELFKHEELFELELETSLPVRLSFIGLFTCCDREGRFKWRPRTLKTDIFPYDNVDFSRVLDALATRGFVVKYRVNDEDFGFIPTFRKHQVINNRESASSIPEPDENSIESVSSTREARVSDASSTRLKQDQGEWKGNGREMEEEGKEDMSGKPDDVREVLDFLNAKTNSGYRLVASNIEKISSRLKEGATVDEMKQVIARKCAEWMGTTMEKYLRPETLFNATKYNQYVGQLGKPIMRHGMDDRAAQMKLVADELTGRSTTNEYDPEDPFTIEASARRIA
jgi:uncharacterized phage protein (TIGR02220 family)